MTIRRTTTTGMLGASVAALSWSSRDEQSDAPLTARVGTDRLGDRLPNPRFVVRIAKVKC